MSEEGIQKVGEVTHFFTDIGVAVVKLSGSLEVGDRIRVKGATTDFEQDVNSIQIDQEDVEEAGKGDEVGMKVKGRVRDGDNVYKL